MLTSLFEPSEHVWWEWGLILNMNSSLLPSCWGFSFALGRVVSPQSHSSTYCLTEVSLTLDVGYLFSASHCSGLCSHQLLLEWVNLTSLQFSHSVVSNSLQPHGLLAAHQASLSIIKSWSLLKLSCSEGSNKPCVHQDPETPQRLRQNCV